MHTITLLFFGHLADTLEGPSENLPLSAASTTCGEIIATLKLRGEHWQRALESDSLNIAVNQELADVNTPVNSGDEVAFFPPVTGG